MIRSISAVLAGYASWSMLWLAGNALFFKDAARAAREGRRYEEVAPLAAALALSMACSLLAGRITAAVARYPARGTVTTTALLLLATGAFVQAGVWSLQPLWYHLVFLTALVPVTRLGARLGRV